MKFQVEWLHILNDDCKSRSFHNCYLEIKDVNGNTKVLVSEGKKKILFRKRETNLNSFY